MAVIRPSHTGLILLAVIAIVLPLTIFTAQHPNKTQQNAAGNSMPYVQGNKIMDGSGNQILLHGAQIPSELNSTWKGGAGAQAVLNPTVFAAMHSWGMNTLRLPVAAYLYQQSGYMAFLDQVVQQANQAGLYVIFANFEVQSAGGGSGVLDQQGLTFWQFMAQHYANNPMVMYDLINEPQNSSYAEWLNGGGNVIGMQQAVNAIRSAGGKQIIVAEAINTSTAYFQGFTSFIQDPNIVYSNHMYFKNTAERSTGGWDSEFGNFSANYPVLIGEWALLPNANYPSFCAGLDAASGTQLVNTFLNYMQQHQVSWTAWEFKANHLIIDETSFSPTTLTTAWCCGQGPVCNAGMGTLIKNYLSQTALTPSSAPTQPTTGTLTPTINPLDTVFSFALCPHGLGKCGDNSNPGSGGNMNPQHQLRNVTVYVNDMNNNMVMSQTGYLHYNSGDSNFFGSIDMKNLPSGSYLVSVKMDGYLSKQFAGIQSITSGTNNILYPQAFLVAGDINNDNQLDIQDYNILLSCFGSKQNTASCISPITSQSPGADIDDDGTVDGADYNLFLREISVQYGS